MTLRLKLLVLVAAVTLFATTGITAVALWRGLAQSQEHLSCEGETFAASVAAAAAPWMAANGAVPGAEQMLAPILERALHAAPLARAWVVDREGLVVACAHIGGTRCPPGPPTAFRPPDGALETLLRLVRGVPLEASAPIVHGSELAGAVRVAYRADEVVSDARRLAARAAALAGGFIGVGLLFGTLLVRHVTRPLSEVIRAADALCAGERITVHIRSDPELSYLVAAFNRLSLRLRESRKETEALIASLNERVAVATQEGLRAERLATLGAIAAGFAHEMGNSLHIIAGFTAAMLRDAPPPDDSRRRDLTAVRREVERAAALLDRFLFFARARSARTALQRIEPVIREAVEVVGPAAAAAHVTTDVSIDPELPEVRADAEVLRQAFVNLCVNAIQSMEPGGGRLEVRAVRKDGGVAVEFQDSGPGVDPGSRERIFEPFFTTKANGTGLGLAIVRQAAEASGGSVEVENAPAAGALFRVRLPAVRMEA